MTREEKAIRCPYYERIITKRYEKVTMCALLGVPCRKVKDCKRKEQKKWER